MNRRLYVLAVSDSGSVKRLPSAPPRDKVIAAMSSPASSSVPSATVYVLNTVAVTGGSAAASSSTA